MRKSFLLDLFQTLAPIIFLMIVGLTHLDFLLMAIRGNTLLNGMIIAVGLAGTALWTLRLLHAERERIAMRQFSDEVDAGADMKELLDAPWLSKRTVRFFLENLAKTGGTLSSQLDQTAIEKELDHLQGEFDSRMELPAFLIGFMIAMGLLGTFIGLLETLTGISGMLDGMVNSGGGNVESEFMKLVGELRHPLAGMGIAFSASMFGLLGSLVLGMMQMTVKRFTKTVLSDARHLLSHLVERVHVPAPVAGMQTAVAAARSSSGGISEAFLSDFMGDLTTNMNQLMELFHRSQDTSLAMTTRVDNLALRLEDVAAAIETNVEAAKRTNDLLGFGPRMKETNEEVLGELRALLTNNQERQKSMVRLIDTMNSIDQKMSTANDGARTHFDLVGNLNIQSLAKLDETVGVLHAVNDRTSDSESKMDRKLQGLATATTNIGTVLQQLVAKLGEVASNGQAQINGSASTQQLMRDAVAEVQGLLGGLQEKMQKVQEVEIGATRHLYGIKEAMDGMGVSLEPLKGLTQGVGKQTALLEATLEEMRTGQRNLVRDLRSELREASREGRSA